MTFPLMGAAVLRLGAGKGGRVFTMLSFADSAGAAVGVLLAGFWLIEAHGLQATMTVAGASNLLVASDRAGGRASPAEVAASADPPDSGPAASAPGCSRSRPDRHGLVGLPVRIAADPGADPAPSTHAFETMLGAG